MKMATCISSWLINLNILTEWNSLILSRNISKKIFFLPMLLWVKNASIAILLFYFLLCFDNVVEIIYL